jgi:hypothetical protein
LDIEDWVSKNLIIFGNDEQWRVGELPIDTSSDEVYQSMMDSNAGIGLVLSFLKR